MMLDIRLESHGWTSVSYLPFGGLVVTFLVTLLLPSVYGFFPEGLTLPVLVPSYVEFASLLSFKQNASVLASVLYSVFVVYFIVSAIILLVAMIGSIALTLWRRVDSRRQVIYEQVTANPENSRVIL